MQIIQCQTAEEVRELARRMRARRQAQLAPAKPAPAPPPPPPPPPQPFIPPAPVIPYAVNPNTVMARRIIRAVTRVYDVSTRELESVRRTVAIATPRHIAIYLIHTHTNFSLTSIGKLLGNRDHTTILHAVRRVRDMVGTDPEFAKRVDDVWQLAQATT